MLSSSFWILILYLLGTQSTGRLSLYFAMCMECHVVCHPFSFFKVSFIPFTKVLKNLFKKDSLQKSDKRTLVSGVSDLWQVTPDELSCCVFYLILPYWCYYPHTFRDSVSLYTGFLNNLVLMLTFNCNIFNFLWPQLGI